MRWRAFYSLCATLVAGSYFLTLIFADANGFLIPRFIIVLVATAIVIPLYFLNRAILNWRLKRGRDIEEEERYETEGGFITLHTNAGRDELLYRHYQDEEVRDLNGKGPA